MSGLPCLLLCVWRLVPARLRRNRFLFCRRDRRPRFTRLHNPLPLPFQRQSRIRRRPRTLRLKNQHSPVPVTPADDASTAKDSPSSDPVADLIAKAEKEYQAGLANYHAGKSDDAKQNFDNALNALLSSSLDVRSDDRLQQEFDHIVAGVNQLYPGGTSADSQEAQQEPQQKSEPAPIDITNDATNGVTPAADAGVKAKAAGRNQEHALRPAADDDRPGRRLHHLLLGPRTRHLRARLRPVGPIPRHDRVDFESRKASRRI